MINVFVVLFPALFGCRRVVLEEFDGFWGLDVVQSILEKFGAEKIGETGMIDLGNYYFRLDSKWVVLIVQEYEPMKMIAPQTVIERIQRELQAAQ